jgi:putative ABC transport system permease protein
MKARVAMTAIGVVIGTAAVVVLISLAAGLQRSVTQDLGSIGELTQINVYSPGRRPDRASEEAVLNDNALAKFRKLPGVVAVTPLEPLMGNGMLRLNRLVGNAQITGIDPTQAGRLDFVLASGTDRLGRWQALAGGQVAEGFYNPQSQRPAEETLDLQGQALQLVLSRMGDDGQPVERVVRLRVAGVLEESTAGSTWRWTMCWS